MTARRVRVGVWGLGPHAINKLLPALATSRTCELAGVSTRDAGRLAQAASQFACAAWASPAEMLGSAIDAVYIATPIGLHDAQARLALAANKHVWCEKSLTHDPTRSLALVRAGRDQDLAVCEAFMYVHHPQFARLRELITRPDFGELASITCRFGMPHLQAPGFRYEPSLGGGALLDVGCYPLHFTSQLLGEVTVAHARIERHDRAVDVEGEAVLASASGARAVLEWGYGLAYRNEAFAWGRNASVSVDRVFSKRPTDETTLTLTDRTGVPAVERVAAADAFAAMFDALAATTTSATERERWWQAAEHQARIMAAVLGRAQRKPIASSID